MKMKLKDLIPPTRVLRPVSLDSLDMTLLRDSIKQNGLLVPLTVSQDTIVDGYRRYRIAEGFGWDEIECHQVEGDPNELRVIAQTRRLDFSRDDRRALLGDVLARERDVTANEIAHRFQWTPTEVESLAGLEYLIPEFQARYRAGEINLSTVWQVSRCRDGGQERLVEDPGPTSPELYEAAQAMHRECRGLRRRQMVSRPRGKGYNQILRERDNPANAGPELLRCNAKTPMDGWRAALNWVLSTK